MHPGQATDLTPKRLFIVDLDGTDYTDLVYVDSDSVRFWFNQSENGRSDEQVIQGTRAIIRARGEPYAIA
jgi:hypothetical protein